MPANRKPKIWNLRPELTAAPELWRGNVIVMPWWSMTGQEEHISSTPLTSDNVNDASPMILTGHGPALDQTGINESVRFDSSESAAFRKPNFSQHAVFTVPLGWAAGSGKTLFQVGGRADLGFGASNSTLGAGELGCVWYDGSFRTLATGKASFSEGDFHAVTFVFDGENNSQKLFFDGQEVGSSSQPGAVVYSTARDASIGQADWDPSREESAVYINFFSYWDRALSDADVKALHSDPFAMLRPAGF